MSSAVWGESEEHPGRLALHVQLPLESRTWEVATLVRSASDTRWIAEFHRLPVMTEFFDEGRDLDLVKEDVRRMVKDVIHSLALVFDLIP